MTVIDRQVDESLNDIGLKSTECDIIGLGFKMCKKKCERFSIFHRLILGVLSVSLMNCTHLHVEVNFTLTALDHSFGWISQQQITDHFFLLFCTLLTHTFYRTLLEMFTSWYFKQRPCAFNWPAVPENDFSVRHTGLYYFCLDLFAFFI